MLNSINDDLGTSSFYVSLTLLAPVMFQFYIGLLEKPLQKIEKRSSYIISIFSIILTLPLLLFSIPFLKLLGVYFLLAVSVRVLFFVTILWTIILLGYTFQHTLSLSTRRKMRLLCLGSAFALAPLLLLTLLFQTLGFNFVSPVLTFPWLLLIPLIHFYTIFRSTLNISEKNFSLILVYYLLVTLLLTIHGVLINIMWKIIPIQAAQLEMEGLVLIFLLFLFMPFRKKIQSLVHYFFYGDETDYAAELHYLERSLVTVLDHQELVNLFVNDLVLVARVRRAALFLKQNQQIIFIKANGINNELFSDIQLVPNGLLSEYLSCLSSPIETSRLQKELTHQILPEEEKKLLYFPDIALWIPFTAENKLQGLLIFGDRPDDDLFTEAEKDLLSTLVGHGGNAIRNVLMAENLRIGQKELAQAHQMLLASQEQERKRIARELHDEAVQKLLGISYQVVDLRKKVKSIDGSEKNVIIQQDLDLIRNELLDITSSIRSMMGELRPVGLDELGLPVVIGSFVDKLRAGIGEKGPKIELNIDNTIVYLSETLSICIFRVAQESIRNSLKHAMPSTIFVDLYTTPDCIVLKVMDDGHGFVVPDRLNEFAYRGHYGLTGILERVQYVEGELTISSVIGEGTVITAIFPMKGYAND
jgi:signal transduction histidine kinase